MYVSVVNDAGAPVPDLGAADFIVREDNVAREVLRVEPATGPDADRDARRQQPGRARQHLAHAARRCRRSSTALTDGPSGQKNEVAIIAIGERPTVLADYTTSRPPSQKGIDRIWSVRDTGAYLLDGDRRGLPGIQEARGGAAGDHRRADGRRSRVQQPPARSGHRTAARRPARRSTRSSIGRPSSSLSDEARERNMVLDEGPRVTGGARIGHARRRMALDAAAEAARRSADAPVQGDVRAARSRSFRRSGSRSRRASPGLTARGTLVRETRTSRKRPTREFRDSPALRRFASAPRARRRWLLAATVQIGRAQQPPAAGGQPPQSRRFAPASISCRSTSPSPTGTGQYVTDLNAAGLQRSSRTASSRTSRSSTARTCRSRSRCCSTPARAWRTSCRPRRRRRSASPSGCGRRISRKSSTSTAASSCSQTFTNSAGRARTGDPQDVGRRIDVALQRRLHRAEGSEEGRREEQRRNPPSGDRRAVGRRGHVEPAAVRGSARSREAVRDRDLHDRPSRERRTRARDQGLQGSGIRPAAVRAGNRRPRVLPEPGRPSWPASTDRFPTSSRASTPSATRRRTRSATARWRRVVVRVDRPSTHRAHQARLLRARRRAR